MTLFLIFNLCSHYGDLGNITADDKGVAKVDITDKLVTIVGKDSVVGRTIVVSCTYSSMLMPSLKIMSWKRGQQYASSLHVNNKLGRQPTRHKTQSQRVFCHFARSQTSHFLSQLGCFQCKYFSFAFFDPFKP